MSQIYRSLFNSNCTFLRHFATKNSTRKTKVVILGCGWGSYSVLKSIDRSMFDVMVVSPRNHFLFTPLLCSTTVGTLEFRSITEPIRNIGFKNPHNFLLGHAEDINVKEKTILCEHVVNRNFKCSVSYDKLIIGVGCLNNTFGIPGVETHAFFLKEIPDAMKIRRRILTNVEMALAPNLPIEECERLLHTVIVGGGPTGIEFGAELYDFKVKDVRRLYKHREGMFKVTLIEAANILGSFDAKLRAYAEKKLNERSNFTLLKSQVVEVKKDSVILADGTTLYCGMIVWSTGLSPQPFIKNIPFPKNQRGQVYTDEYLKVKNDTSGDIYAVGDCSCIETNPLTCTAQVAEKQGRYLANVLKCHEMEKEIEPFVFKSAGMLAYIGDYKGLTDLPDWKAQGFTSWFLWRSAYLTRLGSWRLRMQVPIDWLKTLLFGRDTSNFFN